MFRQWLRTPEVIRWWGEPDEQYALLEGDLREPLMVMRVASFRGTPFAYAQDYEAHSWPQAHLAHLPSGTRVVDTFIGVPEMLGVGHGAGLLRTLALLLRADGAPLIAIDPDETNLRARRAYARAGFVEQGIVQTPTGPAALMLFTESPAMGDWSEV